MEILAIIHGVYYFLTGVWPLVSIRTFQLVTGPKTDLWLVKTVGALVGVIGIIFIVSGYRAHISSEMLLLAIGSSVALLVVDVNYVSKGVISRIYLLDAVVEVVLVAIWFMLILR